MQNSSNPGHSEGQVASQELLESDRENEDRTRQAEELDHLPGRNTHQAAGGGNCLGHFKLHWPVHEEMGTQQNGWLQWDCEKGAASEAGLAGIIPNAHLPARLSEGYSGERLYDQTAEG